MTTNILTANRVFFFTGYPGSGKGTQAKTIAASLNLVHLSTGELFRAEAKTGSKIGQQFAKYMEEGQIIPEALTFQYLENELSQPKYRKGFILDGYPKDVVCCKYILQLCQKLQFIPSIAFHFDLQRKEVEARLTGRLHCKTCELDYHIVKLPPKTAGKCDSCGTVLESRLDDNVESIRKRLDVFENKTNPVLQCFKEIGIYQRIDADQSPNLVTNQILAVFETFTKKVKSSSYFLRPISETHPIHKEPAGQDSVFHNHIDACSQEVLRSIVSEIEDGNPSFNNKIYPVSHLSLGPQITSEEFGHLYSCLPNFHPIGPHSSTSAPATCSTSASTICSTSASTICSTTASTTCSTTSSTVIVSCDSSSNNREEQEAFSTGKMGSTSFNYDQILKTLEVCSRHQGQGVMTEMEEEIYAANVVSNSCRENSRQDSCHDPKIVQIYKRDYDESKHEVEVRHRITTLGHWYGQMIPNIPKFELHHGFDFPKLSEDEDPPITPAEMVTLTKDLGLSVGGWFIFQKEGFWSYRSNEFTNSSYEVALATLTAQASKLLLALKEKLNKAGENRESNIAAGCSMERVIAMWRF